MKGPQIPESKSSLGDAPARALWPTSKSVVRIMQVLLLFLIALAAGALLPTEFGLLARHSAVQSTIGDVAYFAHAARGLLQGHTPYRSGFLSRPDQSLPYLYPPLTLLLALPPIAAGNEYTAAFSLEILILSLLACAVLGHFARRLGLGAPVGLTAAVLIVATGPVWLTRVDSLQGLLVAGSALALAGGRRTVAVALVAIACLVKETALLAAVPVGVWCLAPDRGNVLPWPKRVRELLWGLTPALLIFTLFLVWSRGGEVSSSLTSVHRGMELESIPASVALALSHFVPVHVYRGALASEQLRGSDVSILAILAISLGSVIIAAGSILLALGHRHPATAIAMAVAVGLCATPVLSPQYLLDLLPVLAVVGYVETPKAWGVRLILLGLLLAILTQAEFPYLFGSVVALQPSGLAVLLLRNALLILVAAILAMRIPRCPRSALVRTGEQGA